MTRPLNLVLMLACALATRPTLAQQRSTATHDNERKFRFLVLGDTRSQHDVHRKLVALMMRERHAHLYLNSGDLVEDGGVVEQWERFFEIEAPLLARMPFYPVFGNHDGYGDGSRQFLARFALPAVDGRKRTYYAVDHGNAHFIALDGHAEAESALTCGLRGRPYSCFKRDQLAWLERDLQAAAANPRIEHIFVLVHVGPFSSTAHRSGSGQMRALLPLFARHRVTMIISGHDHHYERGFAPNGIPYVVSGGGGAPLYPIAAPNREPHRIAANTSKHNYLVVDIDGPRVRLVAKDIEGRVLDRFSSTSAETKARARAQSATAAPTQQGSSCVCRLDGEQAWSDAPLAILLLLLIARRPRS